MKLTIATAVFNQLEDTKPFWGNIINNSLSIDNTELLVINNGSTDGTVDFLNRFIFPRFMNPRLIDNPENIGVVKSMQQIVDNATGDIIAIFHNDLFIMQDGFDALILGMFERDPKLGLAGVFGAEGIAANGGRLNCFSNLLEAEAHSTRTKTARDVVAFDGMALIGRAEMFKSVGGFDQNYTYHHFYDKDISLASYTNGWHNKLIPIFCHHRSGTTANRPDYQNWISEKMGVEEGKGDNASYLLSEKRFLDKWKDYLPMVIA